MKDSLENLKDGVLTANALALVSQCECQALKALLREVAAKVGKSEFGGHSFDEAHRQLSAEYLQAKMFALEDKNPALAAKIQGMIDGAKG